MCHYRFYKGNALRKRNRKVFPFFALGSIKLFLFLMCACHSGHLHLAQQASPSLSTVLSTRFLASPELHVQQLLCEAWADPGDSSFASRALRVLGVGRRVQVGAWVRMVVLCKPLGLNVSSWQRRRQGQEPMEVPLPRGRVFWTWSPGRP